MNSRSAELNPSPLKVFKLFLLIVAIGLLDRLSGKDLNFFVFYFLPVAYSAWHFRYLPGALTVLVCTLVWYAADLQGNPDPSSAHLAVWNTLIRLSAFLIVGYLTHKVRLALLKEQEIVRALNQSLAQIKVLESFLSICCVCKKIRNENSNWEQLETYISKHSDTSFSHGYCPECAAKLLKDAGLHSN